MSNLSIRVLLLSLVCVYKVQAQVTPPAGSTPVMVFDSARSQIVLYERTSPDATNSQTWVWQGSTWLLKTPANPPPGLLYPALAFDGARQEVVLFGGRVGQTGTNTTWVWNGLDWTLKNPTTNPPARTAPGMAYDAARRQVVLFGGYESGTYLNDTWTWNGTNWQQRFPATSPPLRGSAGMVYDAFRQQVVLFGGLQNLDGGGDYNDTWVWDGTNWTQKLPMTIPPVVQGQGVAFDSVRKEGLFFGGFGSGPQPRQDTWVWDGTNWAQRFPSMMPSARDHPATAFDPLQGRVVLFGGEDGGGSYTNDTWLWDGENWSPPCAPPPSGLVAWWRGEYNTLDSAGTNHGTLINGAGFTSGKAGNAFNFDGVNDYVSVPDSSAWDFGTNNFTIELWARLDQIKDTMFLHQQSGAGAGGFEFYSRSVGGLVFGLNSVEAADSGTWIAQTDVWYHLAVTRSNYFFRIYVNGEQIPNSGHANTNPVANVTGIVRLGSYAAGGYDMAGSLDEVSVYHRALSGTEIQALYAADASGKCVAGPLFTGVQGGGTVGKSPDKANYLVGESVTLTATTNRYHRFVQWSDGNTNSSRAVTIGATNSFTAIFTNSVPLETLTFKQWDRSFGGTSDDDLTSLAPTSDGGYVLGGRSYSGASGNKTSGNFGTIGVYADYWVVKLDANGSKQWETNYGGAIGEFLTSLAPTSDGGYILGGYARSGASGNKTSGSFGGYDYWVVKLDANGSKQWETNFGGTGEDFLTSLTPTGDGGYILGGYSQSDVSGNKTSGNFGDYDYWVVKLDANGSKQWETNYGGTGQDGLTSLAPTSDGGYILGGASASGASGNKTSGSFGNTDYWVVKLDANGTKQWETNYGGTSEDNLTSLAPASDGGYVLGGYSQSGASGNKTSGTFGSTDYWVVKLDANGSKQWETNYGGTDQDNLASLAPTSDGGYILGGDSLSGASGNKTSGSFGTWNYWVVKLDANGSKQWETNYGGTVADNLTSLAPTSNGGYILGGYSASGASGNKTSGSFGGYDFWVVKLANREAPVGTPVVKVNGQFVPNNAITISNSATVEIQTTFTGGTVFYTLDGSDPALARLVYAGPFVVTASATIRAVALSFDSSQLVEADPVNVMIEVAPGILAGPQSQTAVAGDAVTLAVSASGTAPLNYQWYRNSNLQSGATNAVLLINPVATNDAGAYFVIVSNNFGAVTSAVANLSVLTLPGLSMLPASTNVVEGGSVTFSVTASGTAPFTFQWRKNGVNLAGATDSSFTIAQVQIEDGASYSVLIANAAGAIVAGPVLLEVTVNPVQPNDFFTNRVAISGLTNAVSGTNTGASKELFEPDHAGRIGGKSVWYTWPAPATGIARFRTTGSTFDTLLAVYRGTNVTNLVTVASDEDRAGFLTSEVRFNATNGVSYQIAIDGYGGGEGHFVLRWDLEASTNTLPEIVVHPASRTVLAGSPTTFSVVARPEPLTYQWLSNAVPIAGATGTNYTIASVLPSHVAVYSVLVSNTMRSVESERAILEIGPFADVQSQDKPDEPPLPPAGGGGGFSPGLAKKPIASATSSSSASVAVGSVGQQILVDLFTNHLADCTLPIGCETNNTGVRFFDLTPAEPAIFVVDTAGCTARTLMWICQFDPLHRSDPKEFIDCDMDSAPDGRSQVRFSTQLGKGYRIWVAKLDNIAATVPLNWKLGVAPILSAVPTSLFVRRGESAALSLVASNWISSSATNPIPPLTVRWFFQGTHFSGTGTNLTLTNVDLSAGGNYTVVASNAIGVVTTNVTLVVGDTPQWLLNPLDQCVLPGASVVLRAEAVNGPYLGASGLGPPTYQWLFNGGLVTGETQKNLSLTSLQDNKAGLYDIVASNSFGKVTNTARVAVGLPPVIVTAPSNQFVRLGDTVMLSVSATNGTSAGLPLPIPLPGYQWHLNGAPLPGEVAGTVSLGPARLSSAGLHSVSVAATNCFGSTSALASLAAVNAQRSAPVVPGQGQSAVFSVELPDFGCASSFQWQLNGTNLAGATNPTLELTDVQQSDAGEYKVTISNCFGSATLFMASLARFEVQFGDSLANAVLHFPPVSSPVCEVMLESALELSTNPNDWQPVLSSTNLSGTFMIPFDPGGTPRFYRAYLVPCPP